MPTSLATPASTPSGRSVVLRITRTGTPKEGSEASDLQLYTAYLFDAGFIFSKEDSKQLIGREDTTLYAYRNEATGRVVVLGLVQVPGLSEAVISYTK